MAMSEYVKVFVSDRMEELAAALKENLFSQDLKPFAKKRIAVPSSAVKEWLLLYFAKDPDLCIAGGMEFYSLAQLLFSQTQKKIPTEIELSFLLQYRIQQLQEREGRNPLLEPLFSYLQSENERRRKARLIALSRNLSSLFLHYGIFGGGALLSWLEKPGWQQTLWKEIFAEEWSSPVQEFLLKEKEREPLSFAVHLFGFSSIPEVYLKYLLKGKTSLYQLSFSPFFWGDLCSDKERSRRKTSLEAQRAFDSYIEDQNRLLANFGKAGRSLFSLLERSDVESVERYSERDQQELSLLQAVQRDLYCMENADRGKDNHSFRDHSIQLHAVSSKMREVELLWNQIVSLIQKGVEPGQIVVYAPRIEEYAPYIETHFGSDDTSFSYHINGSFARSSFANSFLLFLSLKESRFEKESVLSLFSISSLLRKAKIEARESSGFLQLVRKSSLQWGFDKEHRMRVLNCSEAEERGTWRELFDQLLLSLAWEDPDDRQALLFVDLTEASAIGKCIALVEQVWEAFLLLEERSKRPLKEWFAVFHQLAERFFVLSQEERDLLKNMLEAADRLESLEEALFTYADALDFVKELFSKKRSAGSLKSGNGVRFYSLKPGSAIPAKALFLLGMEESSFPRPAKGYELMDQELLSSMEKAPSSVEEERLLFLQLLFLAEDFFILSFQNRSEEDGKEQAPSFFVQELFSHLQRTYGVDKSSLCQIHPSLPFDSSYFHQDSLWKSFSSAQFDAATAYYAKERRKRVSLLVAKRSLQESEEAAKQPIVSLQELLQLAKDPLKFYVNRALGMYLPEAREEEEFSLPRLEKWRWRRSLLQDSLLQVLEKAKNKAALPLWQFRQMGLRTIEEDLTTYEQALASLSVERDSLFTLEWKREKKELQAVSQTLFVAPPLEVPLEDGRRALLVGKMTDISLQGLLIHAEEGEEDSVKNWPLVLAFLAQPLPPAIAKQILLTKEGIRKTLSIEDPLSLLGRYILYYEKAKERMSLCRPAWSKSLLQGEKEELEKKMAAAQQRNGWEGKDPYLHFLLMREKEFPTEEIIAEWRPLLQRVFDGKL